MSRSKAGKGHVGTGREGQYIRIPGDGGQGMGLDVSGTAADRHVVHIPDHQAWAVKYIFPVIVIPTGCSVAGGSTEIVHLSFQNDLLVGTDGCNQLIHRGNVYPKLRLCGLLGFRRIHGLDIRLSERIALGIKGDAAVPGIPGTYRVVHKFGIVQYYTLPVDGKRTVPDPVVRKQVLPKLCLAACGYQQVGHSTFGKFTIFHHHILRVCRFQEGIAAEFFPAYVIDPAIGYGDIGTRVQRYSGAGAFIDFAAPKAHIGA